MLCESASDFVEDKRRKGYPQIPEPLSLVCCAIHNYISENTSAWSHHSTRRRPHSGCFQCDRPLTETLDCHGSRNSLVSFGVTIVNGVGMEEKQQKFRYTDFSTIYLMRKQPFEIFEMPQPSFLPRFLQPIQVSMKIPIFQTKNLQQL